MFLAWRIPVRLKRLWKGYLQWGAKILGSAHPRYYYYLSLSLRNLGLAGITASKPVLLFWIVFLCTCHFGSKGQMPKGYSFHDRKSRFVSLSSSTKSMGYNVPFFLFFFLPSTQGNLISTFIWWIVNKAEHYKTWPSEFRWRLLQLQNCTGRQWVGTGQRDTYIPCLCSFVLWTSN